MLVTYVSPSSSERVARCASVTWRRALPGFPSLSSFLSSVFSSFLSKEGEVLRGEGAGLRRLGLFDCGKLRIEIQQHNFVNLQDIV